MNLYIDLVSFFCVILHVIMVQVLVCQMIRKPDCFQSPLHRKVRKVVWLPQPPMPWFLVWQLKIPLSRNSSKLWYWLIPCYRLCPASISHVVCCCQINGSVGANYEFFSLVLIPSPVKAVKESDFILKYIWLNFIQRELFKFAVIKCFLKPHMQNFIFVSTILLHLYNEIEWGLNNFQTWPLLQ